MHIVLHNLFLFKFHILCRHILIRHGTIQFMKQGLENETNIKNRQISETKPKKIQCKVKDQSAKINVTKRKIFNVFHPLLKSNKNRYIRFKFSLPKIILYNTYIWHQSNNIHFNTTNITLEIKNKTLEYKQHLRISNKYL
jgi:hypothetical protein